MKNRSVIHIYIAALPKTSRSKIEYPINSQLLNWGKQSTFICDWWTNRSAAVIPLNRCSLFYSILSLSISIILTWKKKISLLSMHSDFRQKWLILLLITWLFIASSLITTTFNIIGHLQKYWSSFYLVCSFDLMNPLFHLQIRIVELKCQL